MGCAAFHVPEPESDGKVPSSYRKQSGCYCCRHVFIKTCPDSGPEFYCMVNDPTPPPKDSDFFDRQEMFRTGNWDGYFEAVDAVIDAELAWQKPREVHPCGICDKFAERASEGQSND